jgi:hypothetical protein
MIIVIQASGGASRWCETALGGTAPARSFLQVFPTATFLCLHRSLQGLYGEAARAYPWGLGRSPFWPYSGGHPGNNAATVAAFWAAHTEALLGFEAEHPGSCHRLRYEDLCLNGPGQFSEILAAIGLDPAELAAPGQPAGSQATDRCT